jgi:hypothetical protein
MQAFKSAVQRGGAGGKEKIFGEIEQSGLLNHSMEHIAQKLGMSKGLIRTDDGSLSGTQQYAKSMNYFGGGDDDENPAKRARVKREQMAQRAIATAKAVIAQRAEAAAAAAAASGDGAGSVNNLMNRFASRGKQM